MSRPPPGRMQQQFAGHEVSHEAARRAGHRVEPSDGGRGRIDQQARASARFVLRIVGVLAHRRIRLKVRFGRVVHLVAEQFDQVKQMHARIRLLRLAQSGLY